MNSNVFGRWTLGVVVLLQALSLPALAALGGDMDSVTSDLVKMKGTLRTTSAAAYTVHEIQTPSGTAVREYVAPTGKVFAVAWSGPKMPDLEQTLGSYFAQLSAAPRPAHPNHARFALTEPGFVVQSSGHMRAYFGRAYVPQLLPPNVSVSDIQ
jgi:hypothetical protein